MVEANAAVEKEMSKQTRSTDTGKNKHKVITAFTDKMCAKIGQYAAEIRNTAALRNFCANFSNLGESTVCLFKR